jgi:ribosomal protein S18 acetylase RimI-like enzyme
MDPSYTVYSIPAVPGQHHIVQYKELRLQSIKTDPDYFSSSYERELSLSYEQWKARLHSRDKVTIIAAASFQSSERLSWQHKWVGMLTVIGPKVLKTFGFIPPCSIKGFGSYYLFMGVWVHPGHRGNALGKRMIVSGMDWIRADDASGSETKEKRTLLVQVTPNNQRLIELYSSMGFHFTEGDEGPKDENLWMSMELPEY